MPEQGHWEPCSDVEALATLNEDGGRAQVSLDESTLEGPWLHADACIVEVADA